MATRRDFDDSDEDEDTAIDLKSSNNILKALRSAQSDVAVQVRAEVPSNPARANRVSGRVNDEISVTAGGPQLSGFDDDDDEATEFLAVRPSSSAPPAGNSDPQAPPRARGRAVPLEGEPAPEPKKRELADVYPPIDAVPNPRTPRPLPGQRSETASALADQDLSVPRITRFLPETNGAAPAALPTSETASAPKRWTDRVQAPEPPKHRPLPERADDVPRAPARPAPRAPTIVAHPEPLPPRAAEPAPVGVERGKKKKDIETLEADPADGTLIVEVPAGAVVFVNGVERGVGPSLRVREIDRYAKHAIRIHAPGHAPWSGTVSLEGRTAAKIRPALKKRER